MFRQCGDPEAKDPKEKGCSCSICDNGFEYESWLWQQAWSETGHPFDCDCKQCESEFESLAIKHDRDDFRRAMNCRLAGFDGSTWQWVSTYYEAIKPGYIDVSKQPYSYLQVASIGREVEAAVKAEQHRKIDNQSKNKAG